MPLRPDGTYAFPKSRVKMNMDPDVADKVDELLDFATGLGFKWMVEADNGWHYPSWTYTFYEEVGGEEVVEVLFKISFSRTGKDFYEFHFSNYAKGYWDKELKKHIANTHVITGIVIEHFYGKPTEISRPDYYALTHHTLAAIDKTIELIKQYWVRSNKII